ncbi:glycoside hydrolase family 108 protein [Sessilibacter corallicola]|uniref:glycoside hydrolase family 108 protein n=1 Tax=Sessilibacter corallicola TaxID=2904075 RepID=UPI001E4DB5B7|nr:glycosyl hydrolase 108 family protein [Sessilibacter corallicola]MCE2029276.1 N-acetylmuramidase [Sessilibacter corallicola]
MSNFDKAYDHLLKDEGGYVFDPDDPGGETFKGISRKNFPMWEGWVTIDKVKKTANFCNKIESDEYLSGLVKAFYKKEFWDKLRCDEIHSSRIANIIFNFSVNMGVGAAAKIAQRVVRAKDDGVIGKNTLSAINTAVDEYFVSRYKILLTERYVEIVENRETSKKYFYGWIRRVVRA